MALAAANRRRVIAPAMRVIRSSSVKWMLLPENSMPRAAVFVPAAFQSSPALCLGHRERIALIRSQAFRFRQPQLLAHDVGARHHGLHLAPGIPGAQAPAPRAPAS